MMSDVDVLHQEHLAIFLSFEFMTVFLDLWADNFDLR